MPWAILTHRINTVLICDTCFRLMRSTWISWQWYEPIFLLDDCISPTPVIRGECQMSVCWNGCSPQRSRYVRTKISILSNELLVAWLTLSRYTAPNMWDIANILSSFFRLLDALIDTGFTPALPQTRRAQNYESQWQRRGASLNSTFVWAADTVHVTSAPSFWVDVCSN